MATIYHQVGINAPIDRVFDAIASAEGVSGWWAPTTGDSSVGGRLVFHFGEHKVNMQVLESKTNQRVSWKNIDSEGEWQDTRFTFELQQNAEQVMVNFTHSDWKAITELFSHCSTKWAVFLLSLKDYLETGKGRPFPNDTQISYLEP